VSSDGNRPQDFEFEAYEVLVGTSDGNHVVLTGDGIEGRHLRIVDTGRDLVVVDLMTYDGTRVNGVPLEGMPRQAKVVASDEIQVGRYALQVSLKDQQ